VLETLVQGKIRLKLLTRLFLNPDSRVYLRGLEKEFGVSSNTVRYELNKLSDLQLIEPTEVEDSNQKSLFIDLVVVGDVDKQYMMQLIDKAEQLISRKIRVAVFGNEFTDSTLANIPKVQLL